MPKQPLTLREHQRQAIDAAKQSLQRLARITVIAACGTGKTLIGMRTAEHFSGQGNILVLLPTLELLAQTALRWHQDSSIPNMVAVCSLKRALNPDVDRRLTFTTKAATLAARLTNRPGPTVVFATYASQGVLIEAHRRHRLPEWAIVLADEAHHTSGSLDKDWGAVHDDDRLPARRRLYMTATPRLWTLSEKRKNTTRRSARDQLASMDDATVYGPVVYRLTLADAIERQLLADYRIVVPVIRDEDLRAALHTTEASPHIDGVRLAALQVGLLQAMGDHQVCRVVTFHSRVAAARRFADTLPATAAAINDRTRLPRIWARSVHSQQSSRVRARYLGEFDAMPLQRHAGVDLAYDAVVLSNVKVLGEGVDVPDADGVLFADPKRSAVDIVQSLGRALRQAPGSGKIATLIIPVYLAPGQSTQEAMDSSDFSVLWDVLTGLRAHDDRVFHRLGGIGSHRRHDPVLPGPERADEIAHVLDLRTHQVETGAWADGWAAAVRFAEHHGHLDVSSEYTDTTGFHLGSWIGRHRTLHKAGTLPTERAIALTALGISWPHPTDSFEHHLERAIAQARRTGSLAYTADTPGADPALGAWLTRMRKHANLGLLTAERIDALNSADPWWNPPWSLRWQHTYTHLRHRMATTAWTIPYHSHADTQPGWTSWLDRQINHQHQLHQGQRLLLAQLARAYPGVHPHTLLLTRSTTPRARAFARALRAARQYHQREGHLRVPPSHREPLGLDQVHLGRWIHQRHCDAAQLTARQIDALTALGLDLMPRFVQAPDLGHPTVATNAWPVGHAPW